MSWTITPQQKEPPSPYILDTFPTATAAYSLRLLRTGVTSVVRVRRSSDDTEQDFTAAQITDGTLTTFCGAGDGFVRTLYDQGGNGNHMVQTSTANQPKIVSSGSLLTQGNRPALAFDGTNDRLTLAAPTTSFRANPTSILFVANISSFATERCIIDVGNNRAITYGNTTVVRYYRGLSGGQATSTGFAPQTYLVANYDNGTAPTFWINSLNYTITNPTGAFGADTGLAIGATAGATSSLFHNSTFQELIYYAANRISSRVALEANINDHYAIY